MQLLLVEDDLALACALSAALASRGFGVCCCATANGALQYVCSGRADIVVIGLGRDHTGLNGLALLQDMRERGSRVPVLVLTAQGARGDEATELAHGADDYLAKPIELDDLLVRLRALGRRHARFGRMAFLNQMER